MIRDGRCLVGLCLCLLAGWGTAPGAEARRHRHGHVKSPPPVQQQVVTLTFDEAVARLAEPATRCEGAHALQQMPTDKERAVPPLLAALGRQGGDQSCLRTALAVLTTRETAWRLFDDGPSGRRDGLLLMTALPDDQHLPRIMQVIMDLDPQVRALARRALLAQNPTAAWDAVVLPLLDAEDADLRGQAIRAVARQPSDLQLEALQARLPKETDPGLKTALQKIIAKARAD